VLQLRPDLLDEVLDVPGLAEVVAATGGVGQLGDHEAVAELLVAADLEARFVAAEHVCDDFAD